MAVSARVSVVIPCYNSAASLPATLASIVRQTLVPTEIICVDDGSSDSTVTVLEQNQARFPVGCLRIIRMPRNAGAAAARNVGMDAATEPYIAFLDADDVWHERKLELQYGWMQRHPEADFSGHPLCWFRDSAVVEAYRVSTVAEEFSVRRISVRDMLVSNRFPTPSVMLKRSIPLRFAEDLAASEDYEMWTRILMEGYSAYLLDIELMCLCKAPYGEGGLTENLGLMIDNQMVMLRKFRDRGKISWLTWLMLCGFFKARHYRRTLRVRQGKFGNMAAGR
ncbi:MAG: glycosyltransferase family 2 protein [Pseudomonadota bacterium]